MQKKLEAQLKLLDEARAAQYGEIPVHGAEADIRHFLANVCVDLVCGGMAIAVTQFIENGLPLARHSQLANPFHHRLLIVGITIIASEVPGGP